MFQGTTGPPHQRSTGPRDRRTIGPQDPGTRKTNNTTTNAFKKQALVPKLFMNIIYETYETPGICRAPASEVIPVVLTFKFQFVRRDNMRIAESTVHLNHFGILELRNFGLSIVYISEQFINSFLPQVEIQQKSRNPGVLGVFLYHSTSN